MTKSRWILLAAPALVTLAACSKPAPGPGAVPPSAAADRSAASPDAAKAISVPQLAYDYGYDFAGSAANTDALMNADQAACEGAGPTQCQMLSLTNDTNGVAGHAEKILELRATSDWLTRWQGGLDARLAQGHDRLRDHKVASEDLSLQVVDTEAHLKNKEALRDRMLEIVRTAHGKLSDLVDVETQLSQVQADIDATQSSLAVMRSRTAMVHLTLTYQSDDLPGGDSVIAPVAGALKSSLGITMQVVAMLITIAAVLLPLTLAALPIAWLIYRARRRRTADDAS